MHKIRLDNKTFGLTVVLQGTMATTNWTDEAAAAVNQWEAAAKKEIREAYAKQHHERGLCHERMRQLEATKTGKEANTPSTT